MPLKHNIFIGSSSEAECQAKIIAKSVNKIPDTNAVLWRGVFPPGSLVFDRLQRLPVGFSGALFLITPDDSAVIRGVAQNIPRQNVIFEFGLFVASLGRERVALCRYDSTFLDSDFGGFVHIPMGRYPGHRNGWPLTKKLETELAKWIKTL